MERVRTRGYGEGKDFLHHIHTVTEVITQVGIAIVVTS